MLAALNTLVNKQKLFRRAVLLWAMILITWSVYYVFTMAPTIAGGTATALGAVVGILATVIGFYQWHRKSDEEINARDISNSLESDKD